MSETPDVPSTLPSCAIVVLNWKGREHLPHLLPSLRAAVERHEADVPVVIVDNSGLPEDLEFIRSEYSEFGLVLPERNEFLYALNDVVTSRSEDIVVVLNNDLRVDPGFLRPLLEHFHRSDLFAVAAMAWEWDGSRAQHGRRLMHVRKSWFAHSDERELSGPAYTIEASGGWSAYRRSMFAELGGFDRLFHPMYLEDLDLTYRAWMRGWSSLVEPRSRVFHRGGASTRQEGNRRFSRIAARNLALFTLRNVGGWGTVAGFLARLPWRVSHNLLRGDPDLAHGLLAALRRLPRALRERVELHRNACLDVGEIERFVATAATSVVGCAAGAPRLGEVPL